MKTYKTYQEAKMANPEDDIFYINEIGFLVGSQRGVDVIKLHNEGRVTVKCDPADYCMSVYDFLSSGKRLVDGDLYLETTGKVAQVGKLYKAELVNDPCHNDKNRYILRAKALEVKEVEYEYYTARDFTLREILDKFERSEIYTWIPKVGVDEYSRVTSEAQLITCIAESNVFTRTIKKPDWRDEAVCTGLAAAKAEYLTLNCNLKIDEAEKLAKAILSGIEKARG